MKIELKFEMGVSLVSITASMNNVIKYHISHIDLPGASFPTYTIATQIMASWH